MYTASMIVAAAEAARPPAQRRPSCRPPPPSPRVPPPPTAPARALPPLSATLTAAKCGPSRAALFAAPPPVVASVAAPAAAARQSCGHHAASTASTPTARPQRRRGRTLRRTSIMNTPSSTKLDALKFTLFPLYQYRSYALRMPLAKVTPAPIAHEELYFRGLEPESSPPHAHQLVRTPSGTHPRIPPCFPAPVSQAFISAL